MPGKVSLIVKEGPLAGRRWDFEEHDVFIFGRNPDCHARLAEDDTTASRHHFLLEVNPPDASVRDLGSLNGTFVNGQKRGGRPPHETPEQAKLRIQDNVTLRHGDLLQI